MTSTIIPTLSSCIDSIQLKLSDYGIEKIDFEKILNKRISKPRTPRKINSKLILHGNNHFEYLKPVCPHCKSHKVIKQE